MIRKDVRRGSGVLSSKYYCKSSTNECLFVNFNRKNISFRVLLDDNSSYVSLSHADLTVLIRDIQEHLMKDLIGGNTDG